MCRHGPPSAPANAAVGREPGGARTPWYGRGKRFDWSDGGRAMSDSSAQQAALAQLSAAIERAAADLGLGEEPARFIQALEAGADVDEPQANSESTPGSAAREGRRPRAREERR